MNSPLPHPRVSLASLCILLLLCLWAAPCHAIPTPPPPGNYTASAHGNSTTGVDRSSIDAKYNTTIYSKGNCGHCHEMHASVGGTEPAPVGGSASVYTGFATEENLCFECHDGTPVSPDIKTMMSTYVNRHNIGGYTGIHRSFENKSPRVTYTLHIECTDCHDPHEATAAIPIKGTAGVTPPNAGSPTTAAGSTPAAASYTLGTVSTADEQYKICYKCHTDWGTGAAQGGLNVAIAFNPNNDSFHFVESGQYTYAVNSTGTAKGIWKNATFNATYVSKMMPGRASYTDAALRTTTLRCSDCHGPTNADGGVMVAEGPHGNNAAVGTAAGDHMLKVPAGSPYNAWAATLTYSTNSGTIWCFNCHSNNFTGTGFSSGASNYHTSQHNGKACQQCHLANPHGQTGAGIANQRRHLLTPSTFTETIDDGAVGRRSGAWDQGAGHGGVSLACT